MNPADYLQALGTMAVLAVATWLVSLFKRDVSVVDSVWSVMIWAGGLSYAASAAELGTRSALILVLLTLWAVRLSAHLTWRNWGEDEDRRYRDIRARWSPHFGLKSLGIIFGLQAVLAWIVSLPLWPALVSAGPVTPWDALAAALVGAGLCCEAVADWQLARFKADPANAGKVMDHGLWRFSRHPNYFGEALLWWGFYLFALAVGAWWTLPAPILMTWLLLRVSGVVMLESTITERRPAYREYIATTNAFIPGPPRRGGAERARGPSA